jgi:dTDP-4-amino-4,6-dideoxygalactose transaminase
MIQEGFGRRWVSSTVVIALAQAGAESVGRELAANGIGTRRWWGGGLHRHAAFEKLPRGRTENADELAESVIGLPCWRDLPNDEVRKVSDIVIATAG